jgi:CheY-like chemotaxis protein
MDMCTPGLSGAAAIRQLRDGGDDTPIVAISGACRLLDGEWPPRTSLGTALDTGADAFLAKPFTSKSLLLTLRRLLGD